MSFFKSMKATLTVLITTSLFVGTAGAAAPAEVVHAFESFSLKERHQAIGVARSLTVVTDADWAVARAVVVEMAAAAKAWSASEQPPEVLEAIVLEAHETLEDEVSREAYDALSVLLPNQSVSSYDQEDIMWGTLTGACILIGLANPVAGAACELVVIAAAVVDNELDEMEDQASGGGGPSEDGGDDDKDDEEEEDGEGDTPTPDPNPSN